MSGGSLHLAGLRATASMKRPGEPYKDKPPVRFGGKVRRKPSLLLPVCGRFDLIHSASLLVLLPEFAVVLAVELLGRKHERPIVRMERLELARSVEDRPGRVGLVAGDPLSDECPPVALHAFAQGALAGVEQRRDRFAVVEAREEIGEFGRMARSTFIGAMLPRETRPCPVAELVGVDRRVFRKVLCQLQIGAAADAGILAAVRDDRSGEIRAPIFVRVLGPGILRKDLVGLLPEPLVDPFGIVGFLPPNAVLLRPSSRF